MLNALWITVVGMGMVFLVILFLWGLMALLVRLTADSPAGSTPAAPEAQPSASQAEGAGGISESGSSPQPDPRPRLAAAAAVAAALALRASAPQARPPSPAGPASPWLAAHRAGLFAQRSTPPRRR